MMKTIEDVRKALWDAYEKCKHLEDFYTKRGDGVVELIYPSFFDGGNDFTKPICLKLYAYCFGESRSYEFYFKNHPSCPSYPHRSFKDPYEEAIKCIEYWANELILEDD